VQQFFLFKIAFLAYRYTLCVTQSKYVYNHEKKLKKQLMMHGIVVYMDQAWWPFIFN